MSRQLDYQDRVLNTLDAYLDLLKAKKQEADEIAELAALKPHLKLPIPDFAKEAWDALNADGKLPASRAPIPFSERLDGCNRPVPNVVLKVPTGGGKTWLAVTGVSRIMGRYLDRNTGFILWIVPNEAIYTQTLKRLTDRQHPYRQALDRAAAGRVRIMEKTDRLDVRDVETNLCVMLLMLQSSNRENQDSRKMFEDRGDVHGFFPAEGEQQAHKAALDRTPNLSAYTGMFPMVKDSLGNALRIIRPVVVLDEGHRAISDLAFQTLYGFNPCFVLELTATPQDVQPKGGKNPKPGRYANVLVEVTGRELDREGMIKMPPEAGKRLEGDAQRGARQAQRTGRRCAQAPVGDCCAPVFSSIGGWSPARAEDWTMKRSKFTEEQIVAILREPEAGSKTADVCRKHGVSSATFYVWKAKYGGMEVSETKRLRALEAENAKLQRLLAEAMLDNTALKDLRGREW